MSPAEIVRSRTNPLVKRIRALRDRASAEDLALVEGPKLLEEAVAAGVEVIEAVFDPVAAEAHHDLRMALEQTGAAVRLFEPALLSSLSEVDSSQGVIALVRRPRFERAQLFRGTPLVVVPVGVQNPGNLGGLLRTAEAAGATGAWMADGCADPLSWKALRGSMGSAFRLPHLRGDAAGDIVTAVRERGLRVRAAHVRRARDFRDVDWTGPCALLVGSEGRGLPDSLVDAADERVHIPMAAPVESLNVGVAAGLLLFEAARQRAGRR